ncbi:hypothetical protein U9M48_014060 [Paspalum notatum var. saurae]|uniref:Uncharacterized protein n=1 Tax=Paspalum notatum var. saurae TaxID=547442 RepID=A0AAQ3T3F9_PASNO
MIQLFCTCSCNWSLHNHRSNVLIIVPLLKRIVLDANSSSSLNTLKGPAARGISLDFLKSRKRSLHKCNHTKSPGSKRTCFLPLLPASLYFSFMFSILLLVVSCKFFIKSAHCDTSKCKGSSKGKDIKSIGARGLKP